MSAAPYGSFPTFRRIFLQFWALVVYGGGFSIVLLLNTIPGSSYCSVNRAITTLDELAALQGGCTNFSGVLLITGVKGMTTLDLSAFDMVLAPVNITIADNPDLQTLTFSNLSDCLPPVDGEYLSDCDINIWNNPQLKQISLPNVYNVSLTIADNLSLEIVSLPVFCDTLVIPLLPFSRKGRRGNQASRVCRLVTLVKRAFLFSTRTFCKS